MTSPKSVTIVGAGIAGVSAAVFLTEKGFKVTLIEASPKLGGRAYSFFDTKKNQFFDNGQHILAGWYRNTFDYLKIIGSHSKLNFQNTLEVNFMNTEKKIYKLKCPKTSAPLNLFLGLLKFDALELRDKFAIKALCQMLASGKKYEDKFENVRILLKGLKQPDNLIKYFWGPLVLAVFNTQLENVSTRLFLNLIKTGFNVNNNSILVIPAVSLNELLIDEAVKYFKTKNVNILLNKAVTQILICNEVKELILEDGQKMFSDYYVSAVPFFAFKKLFDEKIYKENNFKADNLKSSSIVSIHLFFDSKIPEDMIPYNSFGMTGLIGTKVQWIFKRSDKHLSLVISGADDTGIKEMSNEEIFNLCKIDLHKTIDGFNCLKISDYKVIKEKRATFIPDNSSNEYRQSQKTRYKNFFIAGDWTNTGLPATIESAVKSARIVTDEIVNTE